MYFGTSFIILGLVSVTCAYNDSRVDDIVNGVADGNYYRALITTLELEAENRDDLIREAVDGLFENGERNLLDYGYRLKNVSFGYSIFNNTFPSSIRRVLNGQRVKLINRQDMLPLKLGSNADSSGDRTAYGDGSKSNSTAVAWEFKPVFENRTLTFNIRAVRYNQYLKLGVKAGRGGDHDTYGAYRPTSNRFQWFLVPVKYENDNLFYIVNNEFKQALKLGRSVQKNKDRIAYGHNGTYSGMPDRFGWFINEY